MAYGSPESLKDIPDYLLDVCEGRPIHQDYIDQVTERYRRIGGCSPLLKISQKQQWALNRALGQSAYSCYLGMRHSAPWIKEAIDEMRRDQIIRAVSIVLTPQFSAMSVARYQKKIASAVAESQYPMQWSHVDSYHTESSLIQAFANRVQQGLMRWRMPERLSAHVVFSAHSLPVRIIEAGDPYAQQCRDTARLVARRAQLMDKSWSFCFQSAGQQGGPWLGPDLKDHLVDLAQKGIQCVVSVPVGFISDHLEVLYDIDIEAQEVASANGITLVRPPTLQEDPLLVTALKQAVLKAEHVC